MNELQVAGVKNDLQRRSEAILDWCVEAEITDDITLVEADKRVIECVTIKKTLLNIYDPIVEISHIAHKNSVAERTKAVGPVDRGSNILAKKIGIYQMDQRRKAQEEQARLDVIAREEHEADILAQAAELEADGNLMASESVLQMLDDAPVSTQVAYVEPRIKTKFRRGWEIVKSDKSQVEAKYLMVNEKAALADYKNHKGTIPIPGVVFREIQIAVKRGE